MSPIVPTGFIAFADRLLGTAHVITIAPPRADGGKHIIETRVTGGVAYIEEYEDPEEAARRYREIATSLLDDPSPVTGHKAAPRLAQVTPLPSAD
jgi:hypothetical protein